MRRFLCTIHKSRHMHRSKQKRFKNNTKENENAMIDLMSAVINLNCANEVNFPLFSIASPYLLFCFVPVSRYIYMFKFINCVLCVQSTNLNQPKY